MMKEKKAAWWKKEHGERGTVKEKAEEGKGDGEDAKEKTPPATMANFIVLVSIILQSDPSR